nr:retrovirus-related Pol polyprotein from transposon TNT 1-94 [Tanacetum cinerariifolium]
DFQDSPDNEEDTRGSHEYLNDLEEEYQARALLAKSKRFFKKGTQRFSSAKATDQTECYKCGKKCHFARDYWSKTLVPSYQSPFKLKPLSSSQHIPELRSTKDFEAKYNKAKDKMALLSSSALASKAVTVKNKCLIAEAYELDEEKVSSDDNEMVEVKVLIDLAVEKDAISKEGARNSEWVKISIRKRILRVDQLTKDPSSSRQKDLVFVKSSADDTKVSIPGVERPWLSKVEAPDYDSADESSVCSNSLPPLKKLDGAKPICGLMTIKLILRSKFTFKAETLKGIIINKPSLAPAKGNKSSSASKVNSALAGKLKSVKIKDDPLLAIVMKELNDLKLQIIKNQSSINHNRIISLKRGIKPINPQDIMKSYQTCGSIVLTTSDHNDINWFRRGKELQAKKSEALKLTKVESSNANRSKTPTKSGCSRHMTGFKSYMHKYVEQPRPKVVFGDDSTCTTEGYGSIKCNGIVFIKVAFVNGLKYNLISIGLLYDAKYIVQFDEKKIIIFNSNKEFVMLSPRVRDVYVLEMTSSAQESCFFTEASNNLNWLWHKRLARLNFKTINKLAKQNLVIGFPLLVYSKDKPCSSCEKRKHQKASFKTKQTTSIKKCLHLLHMDLFVPVTPRSINHEKYTLVIIYEYSSNDHVAKIMGYGDYQIENVTISRVYFVDGLGHNLFSVGQFVPSDLSLSMDSIHTIMHPDHQISEHNSKWTKDHPLKNIIGEITRTVSTRMQLHEQALFSYYDAFLASVKPKTYKDALTQSCWIKTMQEELDEFERLEVWELVPRPDKFMFITLKWIYKVKLDELGGILKNKTRLVACYRQEEGIDIEESFDPVYVSQPNEFVDPDNPNHVYKLKKALYGLKQAPRTCPRGIFINQSKYALESLKKYGFESCDPVDTPMVEKSKLDEDKEGKAVDPSHYRGMIGTLLYLTASKKSAAISSTEAEHIAISGYCAQILRMRSQLTDYSIDSTKFQCTVITKVPLPYAAIMSNILEYQLANILTKSLVRERIEFLINKLGIRSFTPETLQQLKDEVDE